jgi:predicted porin
MQKKLLAAAVAAAAAGMFAAPAAMAQSSVTISGVFKVGIDQWRISNRNAARVAGSNSETRVTDNSSRMIFGITEDMGGGLSGIAQLDARFAPDDASGGFAESGNTWVGIRSNSLGSVTFGRHDLHYGKQPDDIASKAGALMAAAVSLMDYTYNGIAIASATRTPNVIRYDTPNFSGFAATLAYSTSGTGNDADLGTGARKGNAFNINPSYTSGPFQLGWSYWKQKADGAAANADQTSNVFYGYYRFGAFKVGGAINQSEVETPGVGGAATVTTADRRSWTIPASWSMGPHNVYAHYTKADEDDSAAAANLDTKARMIAFAYVYDLSKRTSVGLTYASIRNGANAAYNLFTNNNAAALGSVGSPSNAGEDPRLIAFTVRHAF